MKKTPPLLLLALVSCQTEHASNPSDQNETKKIGVLLVNHGSRSETWRNMLLDLEGKVEPEILKDTRITDVRTAFMEYNEPSIATRLREFDEEGFEEVILVPIFITVSSHSLDDIPTIAGMKHDPEVLAALKEEKIETYRPKARVTMTPTLDTSQFLKQNITKRFSSALSEEGWDSAGLVMVAYGDAAYNQQWEELLQEIGRFAQVKGQAGGSAYSWCGHLVHYAKQPTMDAINQVLAVEDQVVVVPVLVAWDEDFQKKIIGGAIQDLNLGKKIYYTDDAILPDPVLENWVIESIRNVLNPVI